MAGQVARPNRLRVTMQVFARGVDRNGTPFDIKVDSTNVSRGGLMFQTDKDVALGAQLEIVVQRPPLGRREFPPLFTTGKVVRATPSEETFGFDIGVEFTGPRLHMFSAETTS